MFALWGLTLVLCIGVLMSKIYRSGPQTKRQAFAMANKHRHV